MDRKIVVLCIFCVFCLAGFVFLYIRNIGGRLKRASGPVPNEIYVWQRQWDSGVSEAISETASEVTGFAILAAEVSFRQGNIEQIVRVPVNYRDLKMARKPVTLVLRIGPFSETFREKSKITELLSKLAGSLIIEAWENDIEPKELQIDFDCAESKLADYRQLVKALRGEISLLRQKDSTEGQLPLPVVITALPCWLKHRSFKALAQEADGFVLQVHSVELPKDAGAQIELCNIDSSLKWAERAARLGVPFRVALPTYGYAIGFDKDGKFLGISAEGPSNFRPDDAIVRVVGSDAAAIAGLVRKWHTDRPANMQGLIWYRLPVSTDRLNWKPQTLSMVIKGITPRREIEVDIDRSEAGLAKISLANTGQLDCLPDFDVKIECRQSEIIAADGMNGFVFENNRPSGVSLKFAKDHSFSKINPGEQLMIGWLRINGETEVKAYVNEMD
ncbi:MAG: DUF3142 domain-containing protein [Sedimentisphaerales bacterium]|nr:DUF3142 domain-containing protein [Sedimentisphaerales bacterium]